MVWTPGYIDYGVETEKNVPLFESAPICTLYIGLFNLYLNLIDTIQIQIISRHARLLKCPFKYLIAEYLKTNILCQKNMLGPL